MLGLQNLLLAVVTVTGVSVALPATQLSDRALATQIDTLISRAVPNGFGGAVVIEREGHIVLSRGWGLANRDTRTPFTPDTIAPISSITKSVTALAILQLAQEGRIDVDATVGGR